MGDGVGEERERRYTEKDRKRHTEKDTERGRNKNRETKIRTKRRETEERQRWSEVATYTHTPTGGKETRHTKRKPPQRCKEKERKVQDRGRSRGERRESCPGRQGSGTWEHREGDAKKSVSLPATLLSAALPLTPSSEVTSVDTQL